MPLAWDAKSAKLEIIDPALPQDQAVLADFQKVPSSLGMWSGSTPPEGVTAEIVDLKETDPTKIAQMSLKGKLALTRKNPADFKWALVRAGAVGAINAFTENPGLEDGRQWINAWGDNGWGFTKASTPLLSFSVTPRQAAHLRALLAQGKTVKLHAVAETRYYEGRYPWITGVIPGADPSEEVLVLGHTSEQGSQDNATGVSAMVEAVSTLSQLIGSGKLPQPRRSIRILLMPEMYGSLSYITTHAERMRHTVAALTIDTPAASYDLAGTEYTFYLNPHVAMSYTDALALRIAEAYLSPRRLWHWSENTPGTDSYLGEPTVGVPDVWIYSGTGVVTHHNSEDKPETVDPRSLHDVTTMIATYLYFNATAGEPQIPWLAQITLDHVFQEMTDTASAAIDGMLSWKETAGSYGLAREAYFGERGKDAVLSVLRLAPKDRRERVKATLADALRQVDTFREFESARLRAAGARMQKENYPPDAEKIVVRRKRVGTLPLDDLAQDQWEGYPSGAWASRVIIALYWCDGKRNLAQVIHLTEMELGASKFDYAGYFRFLERHGYVEFVH
jgi:hypothetical protein